MTIDLRDAGVGLSQVLPVVVQHELDHASGRSGGLNIVEQPELHLHPGAHGGLADLYIEAVTRGTSRFLIDMKKGLPRSETDQAATPAGGFGKAIGDRSQKEPEAEGGDSTYVLDGQHRLATLFGATHVTGEPPERAADRIWWMWYDLEREEFTHDLPAADGAHHLPLRHMLSTTEFLRFCARLTKKRPSESSALVARAEKVVRLLRGYRLPVVRVRGGRLEDALELFVRLNSSGKPMTEEQLRAARAYREGEAEIAVAHP